MATFTPTLVWYEGSQERFACKLGVLTLTEAEGGTVGDIPASVFGFSKILDVPGVIVDPDDAPVLITVSADRTSLLGVAATTAEEDEEITTTLGLTDLPAGDYTIKIKGY